MQLVKFVRPEKKVSPEQQRAILRIAERREKSTRQIAAIVGCHEWDVLVVLLNEIEESKHSAYLRGWREGRLSTLPPTARRAA